MDAHVTEIKCLLNEYTEKAGSASDDEILAVRREQNAKLLELLQNQKRVMDFFAGEKIEPQTHFGEGVLIGTFGENIPAVEEAQ